VIIEHWSPAHEPECRHEDRKVQSVSRDIAYMRCLACHAEWTTLAIRWVLENYA
jgi:hypothetical protein